MIAFVISSSYQLPSLLPFFSDVTPSSPSSAWATAEAFDFPGFLQIAQHPANHVAADARTGTFKIGKCESFGKSINYRLDDFRLRSAWTLDLTQSRLEFAVATLENKQ
jgi:hypothetical protein